MSLGLAKTAGPSNAADANNAGSAGWATNDDPALSTYVLYGGQPRTWAGVVSNPLLVGQIAGGAVAGRMFYKVSRVGSTLSVRVSNNTDTWFTSSAAFASVASVEMATQPDAYVPPSHGIMVGVSWDGASPPTSTLATRALSILFAFSYPTAVDDVVLPALGICEGVPCSVRVRMRGADALNSSTLSVFAVRTSLLPRVAPPSAGDLLALLAEARVGSGRLETDGTSVVSCTFPTAGEYTLYVTTTSQAMLTSDALRSPKAATVRAFAYPTRIVDLQVPSTAYATIPTTLSVGLDVAADPLATYHVACSTVPDAVHPVVCGDGTVDSATATRVSTANCVFPSAMSYYISVLVTSPNGAERRRLDYPTAVVVEPSDPLMLLPDKIANVSGIDALWCNQTSQCSLTLAGPGLEFIDRDNIQVKVRNLQTSVVTDGVVSSYAFDTGLVVFSISPTTTGLHTISAVVSTSTFYLPLQYTVTLDYNGTDNKTVAPFFIDATQPTRYIMPTRVLGVSPLVVQRGVRTTLAFGLSARNVVRAIAYIYYASSTQATDATQCTPCGFGAVDASGVLSGRVKLDATGAFSLYLSITSPSGVAGPLLRVPTAVTVREPPSAAGVALSSGGLVYRTSQTLVVSLVDASGVPMALNGGPLADAVSYVGLRQGPMSIWATNYAGAVKTGGAWPDELRGALVCALPLDSPDVSDVRARAGGLPGAATVRTTGATYVQSAVSRLYGASTWLDGQTSVVVTDLPRDGRPPSDAGLTVECWLCPCDPSDRPVLTLLDASGGRLAVRTNARSVWFDARASTATLSTLSAPAACTPSVWTHLAVVQYARATTLYLDGTACSTLAHSALQSAPSTVHIGATESATDARLVGYVTDVRVYLAAKYTSSFSIATDMVPLVAVAKPNPRSIQFQALAASYRRMRLFFGTVDASTELTTTVAPRAFPFPTTVRAFSITSAFHTATTALTFSILPWDMLTPGRVVLYTTTTVGAEPTELGVDRGEQLAHAALSRPSGRTT